LPVTTILGLICFVELFGPSLLFYDFFRDAINALLAAGIMFLAIIQLRAHLDNVDTFRFELGKSLIATILWLWLVLDSAFGPWQDGCYNCSPEWQHQRKVARLQRSFLSLIILFTIFYPTLGYSLYVWKKDRNTPVQDTVADERAPLLG